MLEHPTQQPSDENINEPKQTKKSSGTWEIVKFFVLALAIVIPIRYFVAQPYIVQGASMEPTFETNQYIIIEELSYRFDEPKRGDVIVLRYPKNPKKFFIKRIIGLPGETIIIKDGVVSIKNKDATSTFALDEPYIVFPKTDSSDDETILLKENLDNPDLNEYYVMGDNRAQSSDSRDWGVLQKKLIVGRTMVRLFPFEEIGLFPGQNFHYTIEQSAQ